MEYAGDSHEGGGPRHQLHFGTEYKVKPPAADLHVGVGLSSATVDHFIGIGYLFRLQAVRRQLAWNVCEIDSTDARAYSRL